MPASACPAENWLEANQHEIVYCPNQPGTPILSMSACAKRYMRACREELEDLAEENLFFYTLKKGLKRCIECPIGKRLARSL